MINLLHTFRKARKSQELGPSFVDLPSDITTEILLKLPMKCVLICRCVCRRWNTLISDPDFAKLLFARTLVGVMIRPDDHDPNRVAGTLHLLEYEPEMVENEYKRFCFFVKDLVLERNCIGHVKHQPKFKLPLLDGRLFTNKRDESKRGGSFAVVNSCNGLLCLCDPRDRDPLVVCNPITGEFIRLPEATRVTQPSKLLSSGLGFHKRTNEYKVMRIWIRRYSDPGTRHRVFGGMIVEMHILGTSSWRNIGAGPWNLIGPIPPTCVNGTLHWIGLDDYVHKVSILTFNFDTERFQPFPSPPCMSETENIRGIERAISLGELRDSLYVCHSSNEGLLTIWVMEKYGIGGSWTQVFEFHNNYAYPWPTIKHFKFDNGFAILMYYTIICLVYYAPRNQVFKILRDTTSFSKIEAIPHTPSLISLKDVVKGDNVEVLSVYTRNQMKIFSWPKKMLRMLTRKKILRETKEYTS